MEALALWVFASEREDRINCSVLRIENRDNKNCAIATNGCVAGVVRWVGTPLESSQFSAEAVGRCWDGTGVGIVLSGGDLDFGMGITLAQDFDPKFPDWTKIYPKEKPKQESPVGFSHQYLKMIGDYCEAAGIYPIGSLSVGGEFDPMTISLKSGDSEIACTIEVVLMPARLEGSDL